MNDGYLHTLNMTFKIGANSRVTYLLMLRNWSLVI